MIQLERVTKYYPSSLGNQYIFRDLSFTIPGNKNIAILGANGAGKSTLFRLMAGSEYPNSGVIKTSLSLSWPVALATGIHPQMTGRENTRFIGRVNGVENLRDYENRVQEFSQLGKSFDLLVKDYSSGMRPRLAFACSIAIDFDVYLIDEVTSVGDATFRKKAKEALLEAKEKSNVIMVSHQMSEIREFCDSAIVIKDKALTFYPELEEGVEVYKTL
jgi:capsular polysaccharide transport system ATP-binding protein